MIRIYINNDFEANSTSLMSNVQWANVKFFSEPIGELYGWLLATLVKFCHWIVSSGHGCNIDLDGSTLLDLDLLKDKKSKFDGIA